MTLHPLVEIRYRRLDERPAGVAPLNAEKRCSHDPAQGDGKTKAR